MCRFGSSLLENVMHAQNLQIPVGTEPQNNRVVVEGPDFDSARN